jgi:hypothetical protein
LTTTLAPAAAVLVLGAGLAGCRDATVIASGTATGNPPAASAPPTGAAALATTATGSAAAQADSTASTAAGSVTVSVSAPVTVSGTVPVPVSCVTGLGYRATASSAVVDGDQVSYTVAVPRYTGPGRYDTVVGVTLKQASGVITTVAGVSRVPAVLTGDGGSFTVSAVGSGGRTFTGSLSWTCGS